MADLCELAPPPAADARGRGRARAGEDILFEARIAMALAHLVKIVLQPLADLHRLDDGVLSLELIRCSGGDDAGRRPIDGDLLQLRVLLIEEVVGLFYELLVSAIASDMRVSSPRCSISASHLMTSMICGVNFATSRSRKAFHSSVSPSIAACAFCA